MQTPARGIRALNRERLEAEIVRLGRAQLAEVGASALSLRAVARELGVASSAVYRYVASRDELLTRLIVESFDSLGEAAESAEAAIDRDDLAGRFRAVANALWEWGIAHPHDWALLFGSPVPGYAAPAERTTPAGTRVQLLLARVLEDIAARRRGLPASRLPNVPGAAVEAARELVIGTGLDPETVAAEQFLAGVDAWTLITAGVSRQVFGHLGEVPNPRALYEATVERALSLVLR